MVCSEGATVLAACRKGEQAQANRLAGSLRVEGGEITAGNGSPPGQGAACRVCGPAELLPLTSRDSTSRVAASSPDRSQPSGRGGARGGRRGSRGRAAGHRARSQVSGGRCAVTALRWHAPRAPTVDMIIPGSGSDGTVPGVELGSTCVRVLAELWGARTSSPSGVAQSGPGVGSRWSSREVRGCPQPSFPHAMV